jgi:plasmid maintenance system antidote protein VapI
MKIELTKGKNPLADLFAAPLSVEGEADYQKLMFVEELLALMKEQGISRGELARRMEIQPSRVTSMLSGANNFTIETMVRAARAVGARVHQKLVPAEKQIRWQMWSDKEIHPGFRAVLRPSRNVNAEFVVKGMANEDTGAAA